MRIVARSFVLAALVLGMVASTLNIEAAPFTNTGPLSVARESQTATLLPNGKVLVAGGGTTSTETASAELYDPATGTWTATAPMNSARIWHVAALLPNGKALVAGGVGPGGTLASVASQPWSGDFRDNTPT